MFGRKNKNNNNRPRISMRAARGMAITTSLSSESSSTCDSDNLSPTPSTPTSQSSAKMRGKQQQLSPQMELRLKLLPRIAQFKSRDWIDPLKEKEFLQILMETDYEDSFEADKAALQVSKAMDQIEKDVIDKQYRQDDRKTTGRQTTVEKRENASESEAGDSKFGGRIMSTNPFKSSTSTNSRIKPGSKGISATTKDNGGKPLIRDMASCAKEVDDKMIETLFVEMCFYARLGHIQPPMCLQCAYYAETREPEDDCSRLCVWRRDANEILHPDNLEKNIVLIPCHSVRSLLARRRVDGHTWSSSENKLIKR